MVYVPKERLVRLSCYRTPDIYRDSAGTLFQFESVLYPPNVPSEHKFVNLMTLPVWGTGAEIILRLFFRRNTGRKLENSLEIHGSVGTPF